MSNGKLSGDSLCRPLDPYQPHGVVYKKQYAVHGFNIALRPLLLPNDIGLVRNWVNKAYLKPLRTINKAFNMVLQTLIDEARSDRAQVLTVLLKNKPVCEVELCDGRQDEISFYYKLKKGDYIVRFLDPSYHTGATFTAIVQTCCEYLFTQQGVKRVIAPVSEKATGETQLLEKSGFTFIKQVVTRYKKLNLYEAVK